MGIDRFRKVTCSDRGNFTFDVHKCDVPETTQVTFLKRSIPILRYEVFFTISECKREKKSHSGKKTAHEK